MLMNPSRRRVEGNTGGGIPAAFFGVPRHGTTGCCPCLAAPVLMLDPGVAPSMAPRLPVGRRSFVDPTEARDNVSVAMLAS